MAAEARATLPPEGRPGSMFWQQKLDGYRVIVYVRAGRLYLQSRSGADLTPPPRTSGRGRRHQRGLGPGQ
ncbi:hypothetical protein G3M55_60235 [Streptomyces sp. SID8455]|nr:hypothetical protein [Streptomyces sp. SID8455]